MVFLAHAFLGPNDRSTMVAREGFHPALIVGGALAQDFLAHYRNAEHLTEEIHHLLGPRQGAEVTVNDNAVEAVVDEDEKAAEQLGISRRTLTRKLSEYKITAPTGDPSQALGTLSLKQKKFFRARVEMPVVVRDSRGQETRVKAVNLSVGGMGLEGLPDPRRSEGLVDVSFVLPTTQTQIEAKAQIVWADLDGRAGATFVVIEPAMYKELQQWTNERMKEEGWELPL